jgi:dolichyl-phosphate beta-glucosyltransferase
VPDLSIVIPAFNELRRLPATLRKIYAWLDAKGLRAEVLVVDDGSNDGMPDAVRKEFGAREGFAVLSYGGNRGKGMAVRHGFLHATGDRVLMTDADLSTPIEELEKLELAMAERRADVAIGSRALGQVVVAQRGVRSFAGKIFNKLMRGILFLPFHDTQCGFKLFRREACRPVFEAMRVERFSFDVEMIFLALRAGLVVVEVPVRWYNDPETKVRFLRDSSRMFADVCRIRWWSVTGVYPRFPARAKRETAGVGPSP